MKELLIDGRWNQSLVRRILMEEEVELVSGLTVSPANAPDKRIWAFTKDGLYSVKSGYHLERTRRRRAYETSS